MEDMGSSISGEASDRSESRHLWRRIWGTRMPPKVRNFTWRLWKNILATKVNLKKQHITNDDLCTSCKVEAETSGHMLWFCDSAKEVWSGSKLVFPFVVDDKWEFSEVIWQIVKHSPKDSGLLEKTATISWEIWKNRNVVRNGGARIPRSQLLKRALTQVEEFRAAHEEVPPQ